MRGCAPVCTVRSSRPRDLRMIATGRSITLDDAASAEGAELHWFVALPNADIEYDGDTIPLGGAELFDSVWSSLDKQINGGAFRPQVIREHNRDGGGLGLVQAVRRVSREDLAEHGVDLGAPEALAFGVSSDDPSAIGEYVSVGLALDTVDEHGVAWPAMLKELSSVAVPHIKITQPPASALRGLRLADADGADLGDRLSAIEAAIAVLVETGAPDAHASLEDGMADEVQTSAVDTPADLSAELAELRTENERLSAELAGLTQREQMREAEDAVASLSDVIPADKRESMVALYLADGSEGRTLYNGVVETIKSARAYSAPPRSARPVTTVQTSDLTLADGRWGLDRRAKAIVADAASKGRAMTYRAAVHLAEKELN